MLTNNYDWSTGAFSTDPKYSEILKLDKMLSDAKIPHVTKKIFDGWQVCYPDTYQIGNCVADAVQHYGSYGGDVNKLEIMGLLTPDEEENYGVLGWLTAEDVFERIHKHHVGEWDNYIESLDKPTDDALPHTRTDPVLNSHITEIINDFDALIVKAKSYGLDIKLTPNSTSSLELYFHDDYPNTILVDKEEIGL